MENEKENGSGIGQEKNPVSTDEIDTTEIDTSVDFVFENEEEPTEEETTKQPEDTKERESRLHRHHSHRRETGMKRARKEPSVKKKRGKKGIVLVVLLFLGILILGGLCYKRYAPSKKVMPLTEFFDAKEGQILLVFHDQVIEETAIQEGEEIYIPYDVVVSHINKRFYFDSKENILSYTTASQVIRSEVGSTTYLVNKSRMEKEYPIVKTQGDAVYLALDFVKEYSNVEYTMYENPDRLMIESNWGNEYQYYKVKKSTQLRYRAGIKSDVLASLEENDVLRIVEEDTPEMEDYDKVMTKDGVSGYVLRKYLSDPYKEVLSNDYKEEEYTHISKEGTVSMVWDQVTNFDANSKLLNSIADTKGVNVVSPTWFSIINNEGEISSLASDTYVQQAHDNGLEVWALCDDFKATTDQVSLGQVLGTTSSRDKLVNRLLASAIEYNLDGINIDFEHITEETASAYLEFLRELSVKCRVNGIVLSVDSYVPSAYTAHYDREEQGKIVDYVVVMAYDEHYAGGGESGSVASIGFVEDAVNQITQMVDPQRVIIGVPFYTRLWREQEQDGETKVTSTAYGMSQARSVVEQNGVEVSWDETTGQNYAEFEADGSLYKIWLEDEKSIEGKLKVIFAEDRSSRIAGIACWKLGLEKADVWNTIIKYTN